MAKSKSKYDYIGVRVSEDERRLLESMVGSNGLTSLSDAVRKLAFDRSGDDREILRQYLAEVAGAHQLLAELVRSGLSRGQIVESDIYSMERELRKLVSSAARLSRKIRRVM